MSNTHPRFPLQRTIPQHRPPSRNSPHSYDNRRDTTQLPPQQIPTASQHHTHNPTTTSPWQSLNANHQTNKKLERLLRTMEGSENGSIPAQTDLVAATSTIHANAPKNDAFTEALPHLLMYGPSGSGKTTRAHLILKLLYASTEQHAPKSHNASPIPSTESHVFTLYINNNAVQTRMLVSPFHIEINLQDVGHYYDHYFISALVRDMVMKPRPVSLRQSGDATPLSSALAFRVCLIDHAHTLSHSAQATLRRLMEKYHNQCKFILLANSVGSIIPAIRSRCLEVRVPLVQNEQELYNVLDGFWKNRKQESTTSTPTNWRTQFLPPPPLPDRTKKMMVTRCEGNLRRLALMTEVYDSHHRNHLARRHTTPTVAFNEQNITYDWEKEVHEMCTMMVKDQDIRCLERLRLKLYALLQNGIDPKAILSAMTDRLMESCCDDFQLHTIAHDAARTEYQMKGSQRAVMHLEAFMAKFMKDFRQSLLDCMLDDDDVE